VLKGNILADNETAEALSRVSKLFAKIALAKKEVTKAKEQSNRLRANPLAQITTPQGMPGSNTSTNTSSSSRRIRYERREPMT
jgi:hypothetical protein